MRPVTASNSENFKAERKHSFSWKRVFIIFIIILFLLPLVFRGLNTNLNLLTIKSLNINIGGQKLPETGAIGVEDIWVDETGDTITGNLEFLGGDIKLGASSIVTAEGEITSEDLDVLEEGINFDELDGQLGDEQISDGAVDLDGNEVDGTLPINSGGTNSTSYTSGEFIWYNGSRLAASGYSGDSFMTSGTDNWVNTSGDSMSGNLTISGGNDLILAGPGDLQLGTTFLNETTSPTDSGAYLVGTFDEFGNSNSANVQDVLDDLDQAITDLALGGVLPDSLDFTEFRDAMTLDNNTSVAFDTYNYTLNLNNSGDFLVQDNGTTHWEFRDDGNLYASSDAMLNMGGNRIENVANPNSGDDALNLTYANTQYINDGAGEINNSNDFNFSSSTFITNLDSDFLDGQHGSYYTNASNINAGTLGNSYFSAYSDLTAEAYLDNDADTDILIRSQSDTRYLSFRTFSAPSGTNPVADLYNDTITFAAGSNITITGDAASDTITIAATGGDSYNYWSASDSDDDSYTVTSLDTLKFAEGSGIDVNFTGDDLLTFTNTGDLSTTNELQNLWATFNADSGTTSANSLTDTLTVSGGGIVTTAIVGDTLTITGTEADNLAAVSGRGASTTDQLAFNYNSGSPFTVLNNTVVTNLNADLLDGQEGSYYTNASNINAGTLGTGYFSAYSDLTAEAYLDNDADSDILIRSQADARYLSFRTFSAPSGTNPVADLYSDTLTLTAGSNISITGDETSDTITFAVNSSGLNADTLDTLDSISFLRSDASDSYDDGNTLTFAGATDFNGDITISDQTILFDAATFSALDLTGDLRILASGDDDDYIYFNTATDAPSILWEGVLAYTNDPGFRINTTSGELEYRDEDEGTWTSLDSLAGGASLWTDGGTYLTPADSEDIVLADGNWIGNGDGANQPYLTFDDTSNYFEFIGGNVGIGTTSPGSALEVTGDIYLSNTNAASRVLGVPDGSIPTTGASLNIKAGRGGNYGGNLSLDGGQTNGLTGGSIYVNGGSGDSNDGNVILANLRGYVGIGTTNPQQLFTISHSTEPVLRFDRSLATATDWEIYAPSGGSLIFRGGTDAVGSNLADRVTITNSGYVGIGTTGPGATLEISGAGGTQANRLRFRRSDSVDASGMIEVVGSDNTVDWSYGVNQLVGVAFEVNEDGTTNRFTIKEGGNVGIGTTSPYASAKLTIGGNLAISGTGDDFLYLTQKNVSNNSLLYIASTAAATANTLVAAIGSGASSTGQFRSLYGGGWSSVQTQIYQGATAGYMDCYGPCYIDGVSHGSDIAETMKSKQPIQKGFLVSADTNDTAHMKLSGKEYDPTILGITSTNPGAILDEEKGMGIGGSVSDGLNPNSMNSNAVALIGRVPAVVNSVNGNIEIGDIITSSSLAGVGMKATKAGSTVGKTLQTNDHWNITNCPAVSSIESIVWPDDDGTNPLKPCFRLPDGTYVGKIMVFINVGWYEPESYLDKLDQIISDYNNGLFGGSGNTDTLSNLTITNTLTADSIQARNGTFANINVGNMTVSGNLDVAGLLTSHQIKTGILQAFNSEDIIIKLSESLGATALKIQNSLGETVFSVDSTGKLTIKSDSENTSVGTGEFNIGETEVKIETTAVNENSKVFVTPMYSLKDIPTLSIKEKGDGYFVVQIEKEKDEKVNFDWWVIN